MQTLLLASTVAALDLIADCGAIYKSGPDASLNETLHNAVAIKTCLEKASDNSASLGPDAKTVVLPENYVIQSMGTVIKDINDVVL